MSVFGWRHAPHVEWRREMINISDGAKIALDWLDVPGVKELCPEAPILCICHDMNGGSRQSYARAISLLALKNGWRPVVIISRGAAGTPLVTANTFNAGGTIDIREAVAHMAQQYPNATGKIAIGYSLGANALTCFCGEESENCPFKAVVTISNPMDLVAADAFLKSSRIGRYYDSKMAEAFVRYGKKHQDVLAQNPALNIKEILACTSVSRYDELVSTRIYNFASVNDYYTAHSSIHQLAKIRIPFLSINAFDDPLCGAQIVSRALEIAKISKCVAVAAVPRGGHVGFMEVGNKLSPRSWFSLRCCWSDRVAFEFFKYALNE